MAFKMASDTFSNCKVKMCYMWKLFHLFGVDHKNKKGTAGTETNFTQVVTKPQKRRQLVGLLLPTRYSTSN